MTQNIHIIVAIDRHGAIGRNGDLLFHISADLRRFKQLTMGCPIIMGRKTFESFPKGPLPGRRNIVVTRNAEYTRPGIETAPSIEQALAMTADVTDVYIIGGGEIYRQALPLATRLDITEIDATVADADTFFPPIDPELWRLTDTSAPADPTTPPIRFVTLTRQPT
ncbi:MAG: dihydrofolate reductase [Muribaculaceae bacterium]|nr:dihydrofolate reductase [Muribaculaceae bacterium]